MYFHGSILLLGFTVINFSEYFFFQYQLGNCIKDQELQNRKSPIFELVIRKFNSLLANFSILHSVSISTIHVLYYSLVLRTMLLSMSTSTKIVVPIYKKVSIQKVERLHVQMTVCQWVRKSHKTHSPLGARARCIYIKNFFFCTMFKKLTN